MRDSNYVFPAQNRAVVSISQMLYDRRALDTSSPLALLNNLCSLTYLTSTSPRIREILTSDGGLERLLDILRESLLPRGYRTPHDLWGLNGPPTARVISVDRGILLKHSLAFQCVVNIGVRGSEAVRTRVVQAGALDLVAQILESWLTGKGVYIFPSPLGSQAAVDAFVSGQAGPEILEAIAQRDARERESREEDEARERERERRHRAGSSRHTQTMIQNLVPIPDQQIETERITVQVPQPRGEHRSGISQFVANLTRRNDAVNRFLGRMPDRDRDEGSEPDRNAEDEADSNGDVDMDGHIERPDSTNTDREYQQQDAEDADNETDGASTTVDPDDSMDIDRAPSTAPPASEGESGPATTPRASQLVLPLSNLPLSIAIQATRPSEAPQPQPAFRPDEPTGIARTTSESNLAGNVASGSRQRESPMAIPQRAAVNPENISTRSSPAGSPVRQDAPEASSLGRRRDTITGRPPNVNLAPPRFDRQRERDGGNSEASDLDVDLQTATINANIRALQTQAAQAHQAMTGLADTQDGLDDDLVVAEDDGDEDDRMGDRLVQEDPFEAEQARLDLEAGAPPGQPGAAQTPRIPVQETPRMALLAQGGVAGTPGQAVGQPEPAQIIIAAGAPRGFHDLGSYVGISSMLNPHGDSYSEDSILLALQLLAYLSKYPHVRAAFHHPRRPMHPTFDLRMPEGAVPLPQRPMVSRTPNIFSLVERFTFRPVHGDVQMCKIPGEIQYWAGVIMRNACRKDDANGGVRQCANMRCGRWEKYQREFAKCRRCRKAKYCSKECQSRAWSEGHRFWCNSRSDNELDERRENRGGGDGGDDDDDDEQGPGPSHFGGRPSQGPGGGGGGPRGGPRDNQDTIRASRRNPPTGNQQHVNRQHNHTDNDGPAARNVELDPYRTVRQSTAARSSTSTAPYPSQSRETSQHGATRRIRGSPAMNVRSDSNQLRPPSSASASSISGNSAQQYFGDGISDSDASLGGVLPEDRQTTLLAQLTRRRQTSSIMSDRSLPSA